MTLSSLSKSDPELLLSIHKKHNFSGAILVELAIAIPVLLLLVCSVWDYTRILVLQQELTRAIYEGLRYGARQSGLPTEGGINMGRLPVTRTSILANCASDCSGCTYPSHCKTQQRIFMLTNIMLQNTRGMNFNIREITTDYDLSFNESVSMSDPNPVVPCDQISRGLRATVEFDYRPTFPLIPFTRGSVSGRFGYLLVGLGENTSPAKCPQ